MSVLTAIFGAVKPTYRETARKAPANDCLDHTLQPRWRGPQVMEDDALAMGFVCHACGREYLPAEVAGRKLIREKGR
jgi:hypothetical protein